MQFIMQYFFFLRLKQRELVCQLVEDQQSLTSNEETQSTRIFPKVKKNLFSTLVWILLQVFFSLKDGGIYFMWGSGSLSVTVSLF
jgi:cytoskeletal protein RodZ